MLVTTERRSQSSSPSGSSTPPLVVPHDKPEVLGAALLDLLASTKDG
jgi:hypothetical protein